MIKIQKIGKNLALILLAAGLFSCSDDDNVEAFDVIGDVLVTKRMMNDEIVFARSYYAFGTQPMETAKVTTPGGNEFQLTPTNSIENTYSKDATLADFTTEMPEEANYQFNVVHEGIPHQSIDLLIFDNTDFPEITAAEMDGFVLNVEWNNSAEIGNYMVRLTNVAGDIVFSSPLLSNQSSRLEILPEGTSGVWSTGYPSEGDTYTVELHAIVYDSEATAEDYIYNIQEVAISEQDIVWQ